jgi:hypothetical protein
VQPDHLAAERSGALKQLGAGGDRQTQAGPHEVLLEPRRERGMPHHASDVGHHVLWRDGPTVGEREVREQQWLDVGDGRFGVAPKWIHAATSAVVVMHVWNETAEGKR